MKSAIKKEDLYLYPMFFMLILYGIGSSTTPDVISLFEVSIGCLLIYLCGISSIINIMHIRHVDAIKKRVPSYIIFALIYFLTVPIIVSVFRGNSVVNIVRDVVPLLYLFLPVFLIPRVKDYRKWLNVTLIGIVFVGISFSLRHFYGSENSMHDVGVLYYGDLLLYPQDPAVQFTLPFLILLSVHLFLDKKYIYSIVIIILSLIPLFSVMSILARAPIGLSALMFVFYMTLQFRIKKSLQYFYLSVFIIFTIYYLIDTIFFDILLQVADSIMKKHYERGNAIRLVEAMAVLGLVKSNLISFFFGLGWGGLFINPVHGIEVSYVHNLFFYFLLKTGFVGLIFLSFYCFWFMKMFIKLIKESKYLVFVLPIVSTVIIGSLFEVSYKGLTFGVVLFITHLVYQDSDAILSV